MTEPTFEGAGDGWITSPDDPRLAAIWPGSVDYGDDLAFPLWVAREQVAEFAPALDVERVSYAIFGSVLPSETPGTINITRDEDVIRVYAAFRNDTGGPMPAPEVVASGIPEHLRPLSAASVEVEGLRWQLTTDGELALEEGTLEAGGTVDVTLFAAAPPGDGVPVVPEHYVAGQVLQTRALIRAGLAGGEDRTGVEEHVTVYPLDWTVKLLLRPRRGKPYFGGNRPPRTLGLP